MIEMAKQRKIIGEFEQYVHAHKGDAGYTNYDDEVLEGVLALLKAQEPAEPKDFEIIEKFTGRKYIIKICGDCGYAVDGMNYCKNCGRKVEWDD